MPNLGYKIRHKEGYFPVAPADTQQDIRTEMCLVMEELGVQIERQHHEVATAGQAEIDYRFDTLVRAADTMMVYKYVVKNVARKHGKTACFMPKPLFGDNGSGHAHAPIALEEGQAALRRQRICRPVPRWPSTTSAASSSTPGPSAPSAIRPPTATSAWCPATKRR